VSPVCVKESKQMQRTVGAQGRPSLIRGGLSKHPSTGRFRTLASRKSVHTCAGALPKLSECQVTRVFCGISLNDPCTSLLARDLAAGTLLASLTNPCAPLSHPSKQAEPDGGAPPAADSVVKRATQVCELVDAAGDAHWGSKMVCRAEKAQMDPGKAAGGRRRRSVGTTPCSQPLVATVTASPTNRSSDSRRNAAKSHSQRTCHCAQYI